MRRGSNNLPSTGTWKTIFKIAWRNVVRHGKRTAFTIITMCFGIGLYIGLDSIFKGMDKAGLENIINLTDSSVRISTDKYEAERNSLPLDYGLSKIPELEKYIMSNDGVEAITLRTRFLGQLSNGMDSIPVTGIAIDPVTDPKVFTIPKYIEGNWFSENSQANEIVLGKRLAGELGAGINDWIILSSRTKYDTQNADDFLIIGLIDAPEVSLNTHGMLLSFKDAEEFLDLEELRTEIAVRMKNRINIEDLMKDSKIVAQNIQKEFPGLSAQSFEEVGKQFLEISKSKSKATGVVIFTILLIAGVGIANTVLMSVYSRIREIGVLRAFGLQRKDISKLFLVEGAIIGVIGSLAGVILGIIFVSYLIFFGIPAEKMMGSIDMTGLYMGKIIYGHWSTKTIIVGAIFGFIVAVFAGSFPARKAAKMEVTDAIHFI